VTDEKSKLTKFVTLPIRFETVFVVVVVVVVVTIPWQGDVVLY
jgi:hypothetical protein